MRKMTVDAWKYDMKMFETMLLHELDMVPDDQPGMMRIQDHNLNPYISESAWEVMIAIGDNIYPISLKKDFIMQATKEEVVTMVRGMYEAILEHFEDDG